jgi:hypothetical protein
LKKQNVKERIVNNKRQSKREAKQNARFNNVMPRRDMVRDRGGEIADWTYGNVMTRVYRNRTGVMGQIYYTFIQDRLYTRGDGSVGLTKSFRVEDLGDCAIGLGRARQFLAEQHKKDRR